MMNNNILCVPDKINKRDESLLVELYKDRFGYDKKGIQLKQSSNGSGLGVFTNKKFKHGEVIMKIEPYVWSCSFHGIVCDECLINKSELEIAGKSALKRCTGCKLVYYCSIDCQKKAWTIHKHECKILSTVPSTSKNINTKSTTMLLRIFIKRALELNGTIQSASSGNYQVIENLLNHSEIRSNNNEYKSFSSGLCNLINPGEEGQAKAPIVLDYLLKLEPNCISIPRCEASSIGLYPLMVFFNHSCRANVSIINNRKELVIKVNQDIEQGQELFINYSPAVCYSDERRENLKQCFFFSCKCQLCHKQDEIKSKDIYLNCSSCNGGRINIYNGQSKCINCLKIYGMDETISKFNTIKSGIEKLLNYEESQTNTPVEIYKLFKSDIMVYCKEFHLTDPLFYQVVNKLHLFDMGSDDGIIDDETMSRYHKRYQAILKYHLLQIQSLPYEYSRQLLDYINTLSSTFYFKDALQLLTWLMGNLLTSIDFYGYNKSDLISLHNNLQFEFKNNLKLKVIK